ncbi:MAG: protein translocase subunit SecF [Oscillospiraceae bacterium]|nr:protein translocase subunit SecF [Oscillospiraceae bacterium]
MFEKMSEKFNIVEKFNVFGIIALLLCLVGIVSLVLLPFGVQLFNLDIDFAGGTVITYRMPVELNSDDYTKIENIAKEATQVDVSVNKYGNATDVVLKSDVLDDTQLAALYDALNAEYNIEPVTEVQTSETETPAEENNEVEIAAGKLSCETVSPIMSDDLRNAAIIATILAVLLMLVYIAIRFDIRSGVAAVAALLHDVLIVIGSYVIFRIPLNLTFIAVILTILGYSINATIIIFDRVRENKKTMRKTSFDDIVNKSIWQTATRSINTTITTLLTISMVAIFGAIFAIDSIRDFAIPLVVGIIAGLYSSMFISGPIWAKLTKSSKKA